MDKFGMYKRIPAPDGGPLKEEVARDADSYVRPPDYSVAAEAAKKESAPEKPAASEKQSGPKSPADIARMLTDRGNAAAQSAPSPAPENRLKPAKALSSAALAYLETQRRHERISAEIDRKKNG